MDENEDAVCCHYRNVVYLFLTMFFLISFCGYIWLLDYLYEKDPFTYADDSGSILILVGITLFLITIYYIFKMINEKVILTDETITMFSIWGQKKEYDLTEVTQIIFNNEYRDTHILVKAGKKKFKIERYATDRELFERKIVKLFGLKGYSNAGRIKFNV